MQAYRILENLVPLSMKNHIESTMAHTLFAYNPSTTGDEEWDKNDLNIKPTPQFVHPIFMKMEQLKIIFLNQLELQCYGS